MPPIALSIVIPCFNEEAVLTELRRRLTEVVDAFGKRTEIILVDDGSTDGTRAIMEAMQREDPRFVVLVLSRNHGHQLALTAGLSVARGERILIIDADLQDPPELLPEMWAKADEGYDVVYGQRRSRAGETAFKTWTAAAFYRILNRMVEVEVPTDAGDFRLITRRVRDVLMEMPESHRFIRGMIAWIGFAQAPLPYDRDPRFAGETKYPLRRMLRFAADAITGFSVLPLKVATWMGFAFSAASLLLMVYALLSWASGEAVAGWTSTVIIVLLIGGAQLFVLGILGEYIGRLYMQGKRRPLFVVDRLIQSDPDAQGSAARPGVVELRKPEDRR